MVMEDNQNDVRPPAWMSDDEAREFLHQHAERSIIAAVALFATWITLAVKGGMLGILLGWIPAVPIAILAALLWPVIMWLLGVALAVGTFYEILLLA